MTINRTNNTEHITIGRNPILTYKIVVGIHDRNARKIKRRELLKKLQFWK